MNRFNKILLNQYRLSKKDENINLISYMDEKDIRIWYFLITGLDEPYKEGEYIFKLTAPNSFPQEPPSFEFYTPNGVYELGGKICISVGEYHKNDKPGSTGSYGWRPSLGMMGFAREALNGLINYDFLDHGIRIISTTIEQKSKLAKASKNYNLEHNYEIYMKLLSAAVIKNPIAAAVKGPIAAVVKSPIAAVVKSPIAAVEKSPIAAVEKSPIAAAVKSPIAAVVESPIAAAVESSIPKLFCNSLFNEEEEEVEEEEGEDEDGEIEDDEDFLKKIINSSNSDDEEDDLNNLLANL